MALQLPAVEPYRTEQERELRDRCVAGSFGQLREKLLLKAAEKGDDLTLMDIRSAARVYQDVRQLGSLVQGGAGATQVQAIRQDAREADVSVELRGQQKMLRLVVSKLPPHKPLMGREWIGPLQMGLKSPAQVKTIDLSLDQVLQRHADVFKEELGKLSTAVDYQARMAETAGGELRGFGIGEDVWARSFSGPKWRRGRIAAKTGPVSYEVDVGDTCWSRHADQLLRAGQSGRGVTPEDIAGPDRARTPLDAAMGGTLPAPAAGPSASGSAGATGSVPAAAVVAPSPGPEEAGRPPPPEAERPPPPDSPGPAGVPARETPTRGTCDVRGADTASPAECSDAVPVLRRSSRVRREPDRLVVG
ncbi:hypothetical protein FJT64_025780 [Amphibalanus amphitrite]|uniref:Uncharacterized protein n=1 Tax=Amphibalanus amphitrite TaxID=1232801 RepID=A0A6A4WJ14_AMPAM|nr:hypothetical protein FJT64_025780 [Amphibalanus amphitrite]